jgi:hypothetical protein
MENTFRSDRRYRPLTRAKTVKEHQMLTTIILSLFLATGAYSAQQSCTATANDCKDPVANPKHYPEQHCTCFTCEKGTPHEKVLCTNDEKEAGKLQARVELPLSLDKEQKEVSSKGKDMSLSGWVKDEDGKTVFINDKDKQAWSISNLDAVKGHEGHRVKVKAKLNEANHTLTIEKLTMMRNAKQETGEKK